MSTSPRKPRSTRASKEPGPRRSFVPTTALARSIKFDREMMQILFTDGRVLGVPLVWFPRLHKATTQQRMQYEIGGGGISLHWPELDEDLSIAGLMAGVDRRSA